MTGKYVKHYGQYNLVAWWNSDEWAFESWVEQNRNVIEGTATTPLYMTKEHAWKAAQKKVHALAKETV
jgi:hypothetical protein